jgi:hypothetical protein
MVFGVGGRVAVQTIMLKLIKENGRCLLERNNLSKTLRPYGG